MKFKKVIFLSLIICLLSGSIALTEEYNISAYLGLGEYRGWFSPYRLPETISSLFYLTFISFGVINLLIRKNINIRRASIFYSIIILIFLHLRSIPSYLDNQLFISSVQSTFTLSILPLSYIYFASNLNYEGQSKIGNKTINFALYSLIIIGIIKLFISIYINKFFFDSSLFGRIVSRSALFPASVSLSLLASTLIPSYSILKKNFLNNRILIIFLLLNSIILFGGSRGLFLAYIFSFLFIIFSYIFFFEKKLNLEIFKRKILYILSIIFLSILIFNFSNLIEFIGSFFARAEEPLDIQETYRYQQFICLLSSILENPFFGNGPGSSPECWDMYSEGVTRLNQLELEFFNLFFQYGFVYIFYSVYLLFISINFLGFSLKNKYDRLICFLPISLILIAFFTSFTNGSLLSINTQLLMSFSCYLSYNPLKK